ncbi:SDR family oxidoreductase [Bacillus suaedaesalsae]|uniref:SDR family oxidoreductase n=1 Tax=Bacillus suaedaesalsae TaxID=2810349 RepID=A0ABS2DLT9_9BACI|nr:SDR family oxidoreductase [Bacillus suaedaesalsae]MBM6619366.1 SDR family oxidoreductase [Bacillus suaedaesalsae]
MNILILGGTKFLGRHLVEESLKRGHEVSIFTRGITNSDLFPEVEKLVGDRDGNLESIKGRKWDAVIDTSGYVPRNVRDSAAILAANCNLYTFISTISVYQDFTKVGISEGDDIAQLEDEGIEEITGETYGPLKALCEQEVMAIFPDKHLIIRPGLIVGPYDPTDRFTYWPHKIGTEEEIIAPNDEHASVQFIDVRDLASFIIQQLENKSIGVYNVTGPNEDLTFDQLIDVCKETLNKEVKVTKVDEQFIVENDIQFWTELPLYIPIGKGMDGFHKVSIDRALADGLSFTSIQETIQATYQWSIAREHKELLAGLSKEKEMDLLLKWHNK